MPSIIQLYFNYASIMFTCIIIYQNLEGIYKKRLNLNLFMCVYYTSAYAKVL